ncbi:MAG TPA: PadR family transcriptional regulator [Eubacteriales bacterium]|jgi:PadR family transcriptional regulator PadR|nr:PadR family transcriptional regulator [Clostridia bacterium]HRR89496.1 PadR family transcriptional regulator [Eubacteriales bacterium]HRU83960.1 PadR family transcriptional regulator [Eubacteriales bacterium]
MSIPADILRGHTDAVILNVLRQGDSYGYEIARLIYDESGGEIDVTEATIYIAFRRLEKSGYITSYWGDEGGGARRRYYKITESGLKKHAELAHEWQGVERILSKLIGGALRD